MNRKREARRVVTVFAVALIAVPVIAMFGSVAAVVAAVVLSAVVVAQYVRWTHTRG